MTDFVEKTHPLLINPRFQHEKLAKTAEFRGVASGEWRLGLSGAEAGRVSGTFRISKIVLCRSYARCEEPHKFLGLGSEFFSNVFREYTHLKHHGNPIH